MTRVGDDTDRGERLATWAERESLPVSSPDLQNKLSIHYTGIKSIEYYYLLVILTTGAAMVCWTHFF
jgi:hypothetical protein